MGQTIAPAIVLMGAVVVAVPLFRRLGLGLVLGYFAAGVLQGDAMSGSDRLLLQPVAEPLTAPPTHSRPQS